MYIVPFSVSIIMEDYYMKKQNIINLVRYYSEKNDAAFRNEVKEIAQDFDRNGDEEIGEYLMELISTADYYVPQTSYKNLEYLKKCSYNDKPLSLPDTIYEDVMGLVRSVNKELPISKTLFYGAPGSGKTECAFQVARLLNRDLLSVRMEELVDSHLGQTQKNIISLFDEIQHLSSRNVVILFDEIDSLVMNRLSNNDLREMGRVTSTFLKELEQLSEKILLICTTNLKDSLDKALLRRFDVCISFDRYSKEDIIEASLSILKYLIKRTNFKLDTRLFTKILNNTETLPYPGDMHQIIKLSLAFADDSYEYDYLRKLYTTLQGNNKLNIAELSQKGYTLREIEVLTGVSKSSVSRRLKESDL